MLEIISSIVIPATGIWIYFSWGNFTRFVGLHVTKGVTYKFSDFYISPTEIDASEKYAINMSPSYVYVSTSIEDATLVIYAENAYVKGVFSYKDLNVLRLYVDSVVGILMKVRLGETALVDVLTGVYSRWYLLKRLGDEVNRYMRKRIPLSVLFIDIDDFKRVNDTYGHDVGDKVLAEVGRIIKEQIRIVDIPGRYGGEEFVVVLPDTDEEGAYVVAERIRKAIENMKCSVPITVSIGVATLSEEFVSGETLLRRADMAMYRAKSMGKNRVVVYNGRQDVCKSDDDKIE